MIERLRELLSNATPGPWEVKRMPSGRLADIFAANVIDCLATTAFHGHTQQSMEANAELIVTLRNSADELLDRLERAEARVQELEQALELHCDACADNCEFCVLNVPYTPNK